MRYQSKLIVVPVVDPRAWVSEHPPQIVVPVVDTTRGGRACVVLRSTS